MKGTSVSRSFAIVKCSSAKSPSVSSYEYQSREKSLAPTGMRHSVKPAPTPGAKSSRSTAVRSAAGSACSAVQPSSLKHAPKPSITCCGASAWMVTSAPPPPLVASNARRCHGAERVVTYHVARAAGASARRKEGAAEAAASAAAPLRTARRPSGWGEAEGCRSLMARHHNAATRSRGLDGRPP